ncbi:MAG: PD40 domain-containing protein [Planctomycetes bacterium]|nr:PD40 domain-containing protein [Planctomycetota bacterium]
MPTRRFAPLLLTALPFASCGGGGGGSGSALAIDGPPALLVSRARDDSPHRFAELALRSTRNLGTGRVSDRTGAEGRPALHPDNARVVFARERQNDQASSRELFVSSIDGSSSELRLTNNGARDDHPVWSPDGSRVLFVSERDGDPQLWTCADDGDDPQPFVPVPAGFADGEPDWSRASGRVVFSRRDLNGRHTLWIAEGGGFGEVPLTDGGATVGADTGDRQPAFSPDGAQVVFVRRSSPERASLCICDVATGTVTVRLAPDGAVAWPRFDPVQDRLWFGLAEPELGRRTLRLARAPLATGEPTLLWPDERWRYGGLDFLPDQPPVELPGATERVDITDAGIVVAVASGAFGARMQLRDDDGNEYYLRTTASGNRQIAGLNCSVTLPVAAPQDVYEVRVRVQARVERVDGEPVLRISLRNLPDNRYDTVVEWTPTSTAEQEFGFRTASLRHLSSERTLQFNLIADLDPGDPADFWIDLIEVEVVARQ